ncbi:MAG: phosphatase PAP2 family protein [Candidatus Paceibacterota bacterium]|jgi:undecaprenyl-diphosphatase
MLFNLSQKKLVLTAVFSAAIFAVLAWLVKYSSAFQNFDNGAVIFFAQGRCDFSNAFFLAVTFFGSEEFIIGCSILLGVIFFIYRKIPDYILFAGTIIASSGFVYLLKALTERVRPDIIASVYAETSPSFPSGHAALSVIFYGLLAYLLAKNTKIKQTRANLLAGWIFLFAMIGYSRLHLGVHFPSDVLAGYAAGFFWLSIGIILFERLFSDKLTWWQKYLNKLRS